MIAATNCSTMIEEYFDYHNCPANKTPSQTLDNESHGLSLPLFAGPLKSLALSLSLSLSHCHVFFNGLQTISDY